MEELNLITNILIISFLIKKYNRLHVSMSKTTFLNKCGKPIFIKADIQQQAFSISLCISIEGMPLK